jgi:uncharacterized protein YndB with AHSA1/START domain
MKNPTKIEQTSEREVTTTRTFDGPAAIVFDAWTKPELLKRWWTPKSFKMVMVACDVDARVGGTYRFTISHDGKPPMDFFGKYLEVTPGKRLVWTNDENGADAASTTTVTFEENNGQTTVVLREQYLSKEAFEANRGAEQGLPEQYSQLDELLLA